MDTCDDPICFLDIDHVLTNTELDGTSFRLFDPSKYKLSKLNLSFLDKILEKTSAKIVIASNWRKFKPPHAFWTFNGKTYNSTLEPFKKLYNDYIIGMLPLERHLSKRECLDLWFEDNPWLSKTKSRYVILEDDLDEGYQENIIYAKHLVLTDYRYGLTDADADKAIHILQA